MIIFKSLKLRNFGCYRELDLDDLNGLTLITGPNASGKSTLPLAISWALYGKTPKKANLDDFINWDVGKNCSVELILEIDHKDLRVFRSRKPNKLEVTYANEKAPLHSGEAQDMIEGILNADFKSFINATMFTRGEVVYIGEATPSDRMAIFKRLLDLEEFDRAREDARVKQSAADREHVSTVTAVNMLVDSIKEKEQQIGIAQEKADRFDAEQAQQLEGMRSERIDLEKEIRRLSNEKPVSAKEITQETVDNVYSQERDLMTTCSLMEQSIKTADARISNLPKGKCPSCEQEIPESHRDSLIKPLLNERNEQQQQLTKAAGKLQDLQKTLGDLRTDREAFLSRQAQINQIEGTVLEKVAELKLIESTINSVMQQKPQEKYHIKKLQEEIKDLKNKWQISTKDAEKHKIDGMVYGVCKDLFKTLQLKYVERKFAFLNYKANEILNKLPCRDIRTGQTYTLGVELKEEKDAINIDVIIKGMENKRYEQASGGERLRIDLAFIFALNALCRYRGVSRLGFLAFDEVLDLSLDPLGEESLLKILHELAQEIPWILVISHKESYRTDFPVHWSIQEMGQR